MRAPSFLIVAGLALIAAVLMNGSHTAASRAALDLSSGAARAQTAFDCDGEPCDAVRRGLRAFHNNSAATLADVVDHDIQLFNRVRANQPPNVFPPVAS